MTFDQWFNFVEGCWWLISGGIVFIHRRGWKERNRGAGLLLAITLVAFGISDFWEVNSGAWFRPWPLLALNVVCVLVFAALGFRRLRQRRFEKGLSTKQKTPDNFLPDAES